MCLGLFRCVKGKSCVRSFFHRVLSSVLQYLCRWWNFLLFHCYCHLRFLSLTCFYIFGPVLLANTQLMNKSPRRGHTVVLGHKYSSRFSQERSTIMVDSAILASWDVWSGRWDTYLPLMFGKSPCQFDPHPFTTALRWWFVCRVGNQKWAHRRDKLAFNVQNHQQELIGRLRLLRR